MGNIFISIGTIVRLVVIFLLFAAVGAFTLVSAADWHVSTAGSDNNEGTDWDNAFATIQQGIIVAEDGDRVLVADGTYTGPGNKNITLDEEIEVRSVNGPNSCIIDLENDDRGFYLNFAPAASVIDGFTIMNGKPPTSSTDYGVGIKCWFCSTTIRNCIIKNNPGEPLANSVQWGAGIDIRGSTANPVIINCIFAGNETTQGGSAVSVYQTSATFINCTFINNSSYFSVVAGTPTTTFTNCIFWGNTPGSITGNTGGIPIVTYSDVEGGYDDGTGNIDIDPEFVDPDNGDFRLSTGSACIDTGYNHVTGISDRDLDGKPRFIDGDDDMTATVDMGAYEYGDIGECDFNGDLDVDGADLAEFINDSAGYTLSDFVEDFGRTNCSYYIP